MQFKSPLPGQVGSNQSNSPNPQHQLSIAPIQQRAIRFQQPMLPTPQQPRRKIKKRWIVLASVGFVVLVQLLVYVGLREQSSQTSISSNPRINITHPVSIPATQSTELIAKAGPVILGGDIGAFIAKYGQPGSSSHPVNGTYVFALYSNAQKNDLSVTAEGSRAFYILLQAPTEQGWDQMSTINACLAFAPPENVYKRSFTVYDPQGRSMGYQRVYISEALAQLFPTSSLTDENGKPMSAGTFSLMLNEEVRTASRFSSCVLQLGVQGTTSGA